MIKMSDKDMGVWNLDTSDMTLAELEEYKKELQRLDERDKSRRNRNIRLVVYALVLIALLTGLALIPGTIRAQNGPVVLAPMGGIFSRVSRKKAQEARGAAG